MIIVLRPASDSKPIVPRSIATGWTWACAAVFPPAVAPGYTE